MDEHQVRRHVLPWPRCSLCVWSAAFAGLVRAMATGVRMIPCLRCRGGTPKPSAALSRVVGADRRPGRRSPGHAGSTRVAGYYVAIARRSLARRRLALRPTATGRSAGAISSRWLGGDEAMSRSPATAASSNRPSRICCPTLSSSRRTAATSTCRSGAADAASARVVVTDDGPGIPQGERPHVFARFWRGESAARRHWAGRGRRGHPRHARRVAVDEGQRGGARFTATLPTAGGQGRGGSVAASRGSPSVSQSWIPPR
jgi:Histidine kinase-, DNA gyrase B-, and HSP90-like ATPase